MVARAKRRRAAVGEPLPFWKTKRLTELSRDEWESLCDGCGKCCLIKLEYEDSGEVVPTSLACRLLDPATARCRDYPGRKKHVPDCILLSAADVGSLGWLPSTCAYRLVSEGKDLYWWHPLVSGDPESVHAAGVSVRDRVLSEDDAQGDLQRYVVDWKL